MKNSWQILKLAKPLYRVGFLLSLIVVGYAAIQQVIPLLSKSVVDEIVLHVSTGNGDFQKLVTLITIGFVIAIAAEIFNSIGQRLGDHFAGQLRQLLTERFYRQVLTLPQKYFDTELSGKITNQLNRGVYTIQGFANTTTNFILPMILQTVLTLVVLTYFNWLIAVLCVLLFPIYIGLSYYSTKKWGEQEIKKNELEDSVRGRIQEVIANIRIVKSSTAEQREFDFVSDHQTEINKIYAKQSRTFHIFDFLRNSSLVGIILAINIITFVSTFNGTLSIGELVLILQLVNQVRQPLFAMSYILTQIQQAESGAREYLKILELPASELFVNKKIETKLTNPTIEFNAVDFRYEEERSVLQNINFKFNAGEKVALVGESGAGKSTIINLILKYYQPTAGEISLGDHKYSVTDHQWIRRHISLVMQDNELFSTNIRDNVSYTRPDASEEDIIAALKAANAYDFVLGFPNGLDTEIGERGVKLSGGQKQRIQIARAILANNPILVLDEATSSLDSKSESLIQEALEKLMTGKMVIIIAHRLSTIQNVDRILVIQNGQITDSGAPAELAKRDGIYSQLLKYQIEGNKKLLKSFELY